MLLDLLGAQPGRYGEDGAGTSAIEADDNAWVEIVVEDGPGSEGDVDASQNAHGSDTFFRLDDEQALQNLFSTAPQHDQSAFD